MARLHTIVAPTVVAHHIGMYVDDLNRTKEGLGGGALARGTWLACHKSILMERQLTEEAGATKLHPCWCLCFHLTCFTAERLPSGKGRACQAAVLESGIRPSAAADISSSRAGTGGSAQLHAAAGGKGYHQLPPLQFTAHGSNVSVLHKIFALIGPKLAQSRPSVSSGGWPARAWAIVFCITQEVLQFVAPKIDRHCCCRALQAAIQAATIEKACLEQEAAACAQGDGAARQQSMTFQQKVEILEVSQHACRLNYTAAVRGM